MFGDNKIIKKNNEISTLSIKQEKEEWFVCKFYYKCNSTLPNITKYRATLYIYIKSLIIIE